MKYLLMVIVAFLQLQATAQDKAGVKIKIQWVDNLPGDFSFAKKWSYPEGVYKNELGQVSCDGLCPEETYAMMDSTGRIYKDSLTAYYKIVDTTHQFHTLKADAWCYEYAGTDFINCSINDETDEFECFTYDNAATHCVLNLKSDKKNKYCHPTISLNSISGKEIIFSCISGSIKIDKKSWKKGKFKAVFDFKFKNMLDKSKPIFWKGKIFTPIYLIGPGC